MSTHEELYGVAMSCIGEARTILGCEDRPVPELLSDKCREVVARVKALEVPLCIGPPIIGILAREGAWTSEDGRALIAADGLIHHDPYARIAALEAARLQYRVSMERFQRLGRACLRWQGGGTSHELDAAINVWKAGEPKTSAEAT